MKLPVSTHGAPPASVPLRRSAARSRASSSSMPKGSVERRRQRQRPHDGPCRPALSPSRQHDDRPEGTSPRRPPSPPSTPLRFRQARRRGSARSVDQHTARGASVPSSASPMVVTLDFASPQVDRRRFAADCRGRRRRRRTWRHWRASGQPQPHRQAAAVGARPAISAPPIASANPRATVRPSPTPVRARRSSSALERLEQPLALRRAARPGRGRRPRASRVELARPRATTSTGRRRRRGAARCRAGSRARARAARGRRSTSGRSSGTSTDTALARARHASSSAAPIDLVERPDGDGLDGEGASFETARVEEVLDDRIEPVRRLLDPREQFGALGVRPLARRSGAGL